MANSKQQIKQTSEVNILISQLLPACTHWKIEIEIRKTKLTFKLEKRKAAEFRQHFIAESANSQHGWQQLGDDCLPDDSRRARLQ